MVRPTLDRLRNRILASLGLSLAACGLPDAPAEDEAGVTTDPNADGNVTDDGSSSSDESGEPSNPSTSSSSDEESGSEETSSGDPSTSSEEEEEESSSDDVDDVPPQPDLPLPPLGDCSVNVTDTSVLEGHPDCPIIPDDGDFCGSQLYVGCVEPEQGQTCEQLCPEGNCVADWMNCEGDAVYNEELSNLCGPYEMDGLCCTIAQVYNFCSDGRPFVVDERSRQASLSPVECADFDSNRFAGLPVELRRRLADRWAEVAAAEHASIASFARFTTQLLAIGAPPELIRDALAAAADEVRHAEVALALASAFEGRPLGLGPLDVRGAAEAPADLEALVLACVHEGCIGETIAALELAAAADACDDPELAMRLAAIAEDETRHAELAWRFVQWAIDRQPELRAKVAEPFALLTLGTSERESITVEERSVLRSLGCLPADERRRVQLDGMQQLLRPCAAALLAA